MSQLTLARCGIRKLPENIFLFLPHLKMADLRQNSLVSLPSSLAYHPYLQVILLLDNLFPTFPTILHTLPKLTEHDLAHLSKPDKELEPGKFELVRMSFSIKPRLSRRNVADTVTHTFG